MNDKGRFYITTAIAYSSRKPHFGNTYEVIMTELKDPRIPPVVSVMKAEVTKDQKFAKIYISVFGDEKVRENALIAIRNAASFLRREVGRRLKLRNTPELNFVSDTSIEEGTRIISMIKEINKNDESI